MWSGNPENTGDWRRSVALDRLRGLGGVAGARVADADREAMTELGIEDLSSDLTEFGETAAAIANLDLVVTVDCAVAHLAGAIGTPTCRPGSWCITRPTGAG